jgi:hypothetical protein
MRFNQGIALCAFFLLITIAQCLSIHGFEPGLPHALKHVRKNVAANPEALLPVNKRDDTPSTVTIEFVNNIDSADVHAYIQSTDGGSKEKVLITSEGQVYKPVASSKDVATPLPKSAKCGIPLGPLGSSTKITMPIALLTGRVYVADGELDISALQVGGATELQHPSFANPQDPNFNTSFGFVEINQPDSTMWVNPTYVDFVGLPIAMEMVGKDYSLNVSGLPTNGVKQVCDLLKEEEKKDGYPWGSLCLEDDDGKPFRVLSPEHKAGAFTNYFDDYINQVWSRFGTDGIVFDLQSNEPKVWCHMSGDSMVCDGTSLPFPKPASSEIWGCNTGPFANTGDACHDHTGSRFCAAIHRGTLLLPGGAIQPNLSISKYYPGDAPHNKYARIVHEVQVDHTGYTFPYDDVKPDFNSEVSGTISGKNPNVLRIHVGGRDLGSGPQSSASFSSSTSSTSSPSSPSSRFSPSSRSYPSAPSSPSSPSSPSYPSAATASITPTKTAPGSSPTTDAVNGCTEEDYCTASTFTPSGTWTTITVKESQETPSTDCGESCFADDSLSIEVVTGTSTISYLTTEVVSVPVTTSTTTVTFDAEPTVMPTTLTAQESQDAPSTDCEESCFADDLSPVEIVPGTEAATVTAQESEGTPSVYSSPPDMATKEVGPAESGYVTVTEVLPEAIETLDETSIVTETVVTSEDTDSWS